MTAFSNVFLQAPATTLRERGRPRPCSLLGSGDAPVPGGVFAALLLTALSSFASSTNPPWRSYAVYQPRIERAIVVDAAAQPLRYNHDSSIAWFVDRWFCVWNANSIPEEGAPGQLNYVSTSRDGLTWSAPRPAFSDADLCANPVPCPKGTQWQPNLLVVGSRLWCLWSQNSKDDHNGCYFSVLESPDGKWSNRLLSWSGQTDPVIDGKPFRLFPTQNPTRLTTGRILAPVTMIGPLSANAKTVKNTWAAKEKRDSVIYTDDDGATWHVSSGAILPGLDWRQWEPTVFEQPDGSVLMFARNNQAAFFEGTAATPEHALTWSVSHDGGATWSPHAFVPLQTVVSRMHVLRQPDSDRYLMLHNDWQAGTFCADRRNLALFVNRGGGIDFAAGIGLSSREPQVAYPQMDIHANSLMVCYSQGTCGLRNIRAVSISPLPDPKQLYLYPRANLPLSPQCAITNGALLISGGLSLKCRSVPVVSTNRFTAEAWINPDEGGALFDNRGPKSGFVWGLSGICFVHLGDPAKNIRSTLPVPQGRWSRVGVAIDYSKGQVVFSVDEKTERVTFKPGRRSLSGDSATLLGPNPTSSSLTCFEGAIRSLTLDGTNLLISVADPQTLQRHVIVPSIPAAVSESVCATEVDGKRVLCFTGAASAGVELAANERSAGDTVELAFAFRIERGKVCTLCTVGDANEPIRVIARNGTLLLVATGQTILCGKITPGAWQRLKLTTRDGLTRVNLDSELPVEIRHTPQATWLYLGEGYPNNEAGRDAVFQIDVSSVCSRIVHP